MNIATQECWRRVIDYVHECHLDQYIYNVNDSAKILLSLYFTCRCCREYIAREKIYISPSMILFAYEMRDVPAIRKFAKIFNKARVIPMKECFYRPDGLLMSGENLYGSVRFRYICHHCYIEYKLNNADCLISASCNWKKTSTTTCRGCGAGTACSSVCKYNKFILNFPRNNKIQALSQTAIENEQTKGKD